MKLAHPEIGFCVALDDGEIPVCIVEAPQRWRDIQKEFLRQHRGEDGAWVLSEEAQEWKISKHVEMILNPILLEENQKKIMGAFMKSFAEKAVGSLHWREGQELNVAIQSFFGKMENEYSFDYSIAPEIDFAALAKAMGLQIETQYDSDLERLLHYCILTMELLHPKLFIFWNLHRYFSDRELELFYQEIFIRKWRVLLMETGVHTRLEYEKWYIIDRDNCEIY